MLDAASLLLIGKTPPEQPHLEPLLEAASAQHYTISRAETGAEGLGLCAALQPDVVLLQLPLPDMAVAEFLAALRDAAGVLPHPVVVIVPTFDERVQQALAEGAQDYLLSSRLQADVLAHVLDSARARFSGWQRRRERETFLEALLEALPVMVWAANGDGNRTFFNRGWLDFTGRNLDDEVAGGWRAGVNEEDWEQQRQVHDDAWRQRESFELEYRLRRHDGTYRWVLDRGQPRFAAGGTFLGYVGSCLDVSERKAAEDRLRESERRLAAAIAASSAGLYDHPVAAEGGAFPAGRWIDVAGYEHDELPPPEAFLSWLYERVHPADLPDLQATYEAFVAERSAPRAVDVRLRHKSGEWRWVRALLRAATRDENGRATHVVGVMLDVTEEKRVARDLRFLAAAGALLASSADYDETLEQIAALAVEHVADYCTIYAFDAKGQLQPAVSRAAGAAGQPLLERLARRGVMTGYRLRQAIAAQEPILLHEVADTTQRELVEALDIGSTIVAPMIARGEPVGAVVLSLTRQQPPYGERDVIIAAELARHAALAVDSARQYEARTQMWEALRRREEEARNQLVELEAVYDNVPVGLAFLNTALQYVRINERLAAINGRPAAAHIGRTPVEVLPAPLATAVEVYCRHVLEHEEPLLEVEMIGATDAAPGEDKHWLVSYYPVHNQADLRGVNIAVQDITVRKAAEEALRRSEERFRVALKHSPVHVFHCDLELRYTWVYSSSEGEQLEMVGKRVEEVRPKASVGAIVAAKREVLAQEKGIRRTIPIVEAGETRYFDYTIEPLLDEAGTVVGLTVATLDITERVQREQQLEALTARLEERVQARTHQVRRLASQLVLAEQRERRRIAAIIHDEMQQMLFSLQIQMSLLAERVEPSVQAELAEIASLLDEVLDVGRALTAEMSPPVLESGNLRETLNWLVSHMAQRYALYVDVTWEGAEQLPDEDMRELVFQLVRQLLHNVVEHAGVDMARLFVRVEADQVTVRVMDEGVGFDTNTALAAAGAADHFGLLSVQERLHLFGGRMDVESAPGAGTRVTLVLPIVGGRLADLGVGGKEEE